jgi:hypothetical protein
MDLFEERHCDSWLQLGPLEDLPELKSVTKFHVDPTYPRAVKAESMARLAKKFPALEKLELKIMERSEDLEVRRKERYGTYDDLFLRSIENLRVSDFTPYAVCLWGPSNAKISVLVAKLVIYSNIPLTITRFCCCTPSTRLAPSHFLPYELRISASTLPIPRAALDPTSHLSKYRPLLPGTLRHLPRSYSQDYRPQRPHHHLSTAFPALYRSSHSLRIRVSHQNDPTVAVPHNLLRELFYLAPVRVLVLCTPPE